MFPLILSITKRYWIVMLVGCLGLLSVYTSLPLYAQVATPTPDVQTVPKPEVEPTLTNTPFPTPTPDDSSVGNPPVATSQPDDEDEDDEQDNDNNSGGNENTGNPTPIPGNNGNNNSGSPSTGGSSTTNNNTGNGTTNTQSGSAQPTRSGLTGVVVAVTLNMRKGPSVSEHIIDTLFMNDPVEITGRDSTGNWWYVCCGSRSQQPGWVSSQLITPDFELAQANTLIPMISNTANQTTTVTASTANPAELVVEMRPRPAFAWQGQTLNLEIVVHNKSANAISNVHLRDDLPDELAFVEARIGSQGSLTNTTPTQAGSLVAIAWPEIAANSQVTATVIVRIEPETASGSLIDNLALVTAGQGQEALAGITIAMPPVILPKFR